MNIAQEVARILKIDNPLEKINQLEGLDTIFEQGHLQRDEAGKAASLLLNAALAEQRNIPGQRQYINPNDGVGRDMPDLVGPEQS